MMFLSLKRPGVGCTGEVNGRTGRRYRGAAGPRWGGAAIPRGRRAVGVVDTADRGAVGAAGLAGPRRQEVSASRKARAPAPATAGSVATVLPLAAMAPTTATPATAR